MDYLKGSRLKIDQVSNGWLVEYYPPWEGKRGESRIEKHVSYASIEDLLVLVEALLRQAEDHTNQVEEPSPSGLEDE